MNVALSHYDLDGISCQIVLRKYIGEFTKFNTGYNKIDNYIKILDEHIFNNSPKFVFITDLAFTIEQLEKVNALAQKYKSVKFIFIDHHPFDDDFGHLKRDNLKIIISKKYSATILLLKYLEKKSNKIYSDLRDFCNIVNAFDTWLEDDKDFKKGLLYNELFWKYGLNVFWNKFKDNYRVSLNDKETYKKLIKNKNKLFNKLEDSGRIFKTKDKNMLMIFLDNYMTFVTLDYPGYKMYIIINSKGKISIRLKLNDDIIIEFQKKLLGILDDMPNIKNAGGHYGAMGVNLEKNDSQSIINFSKEFMERSDQLFAQYNM